MCGIGGPWQYRVRWCSLHLVNPVDMYTEFHVACLFYSVIQARKILPSLVLLAPSSGTEMSQLLVWWDQHWVRCWKSEVWSQHHYWVWRWYNSLCKMFQLLTSVSSSERWWWWIGWVLLKSFSVLILTESGWGRSSSLWFLLKLSIFSLDIWAEVKDVGKGTLFHFGLW